MFHASRPSHPGNRRRLTEYSLSLDNLFIFYVIMGWFAVPHARQHRVLLLGIGLALAI